MVDNTSVPLPQPDPRQSNSISLDDSQGENPISMTDTNAPPVPSPTAVQNRAAKADYALGPDSPGKPQIQAQLFGGQEQDLRQQAANNEDLKYAATKQNLVTNLIQQQGKDLTPDAALTILNLHNSLVKTDPEAILEKKFGDKYINDVVSAGGDKTTNPAVAQHVPDEADVAAGMTTRKEWLQTQYENKASQWKDTGWLPGAWDYLVSSLPFLPWWRQAHALDRPSQLNFLPGQTIQSNIQYMYSLPLPQMQQKYKQAMDYFEKSGNVLDGLQFAQAMVSYGTSDEYISNAMGLADYGTIVAPIMKGLGNFVVKRAASAAAKEVVPAAAEAATPRGPVPTEYFKDASAYKPPGEPVPAAQQLDLFGEQPDQGQFRFMSQQQPPWQSETKEPSINVTPIGLYRKPNGQMGKVAQRFDVFGEGSDQYELGFTKPPAEVNPKTGVFRGTGGRFNKATTHLNQAELPLGEPEQQLNLDLLTPEKTNVRPPEGPQGPSEPLTEVRTALANAVKANEGLTPPSPTQVLSSIGKVDEAGTLGAVEKLIKGDEPGAIDLAKEVPTFADPNGFLKDSQVISRARAQLLYPQLVEAGEKMIQNFTQLARVSRLPPEALIAAKQEAGRALDKDYGKRLGDGVLNMTFTPAEMHPANVDTLAMHVGRPDATLFPTKSNAEMFRDEVYKLGQGEATPKNNGYGWYLEIPRRLNETTDAVRDAITTPENATNKGMINMLIGRLRTAEDLFGTFQRGNRQIAVHAPIELQKSLRAYIDDNIGSLSKSSRRAVEDILRENRDMPNPANPSQRGAWYNTAGDFENAFFNRHQRMPTEKEILAYDAYKRLSDFDWLMRNVSVYRDKARMGIEQFRYDLGNGSSNWIEGLMHDTMPWKVGKADQDAGIWIHDASSGKGKFYYKYNMTQEQRDVVDDMIANRGYRVVQVFDPKTHPLAGIAKTATGEELKDAVNYVITNTWERSPISWKQVDYRPGGHVIYPNRWYVSQPVIDVARGGKATYFGDNNILNVETAAQAKMWSQKLDHARQLYKFGKTDELNAFIDNELPHSRDQFYDLFRRADSPLSLEHPVTFKEAGKNTISTDTHLKTAYDNGNLIDSTKNVHDLSNFMDKSFLMDRDNVLPSVNEKAMQLSPAEQLDPYIALNRAMSQGIRNVWMNDYKISAVENWLQEFQHVMQPSDKTLTAHPLYFLHNPQWASVSADAKADLAAAKAARQAILNFIGTRSELGTTLDAMKQKLLDSIYGVSGQGKLLDAAIATTTDPVHFFRGIAFHSKLGLFNPVQYFVQAQQMANALAIAGPTHGLPGFAAYPMIRWLGHNPAMLDAVAGYATKFGWSRDLFKEMYETLQKTGLYQVGGEAALRDDAWDPHLFRSTFGHVLDAGAMFFNEGERANRLTSFATAFREFRTSNPDIVLGNREIGQILRRADDFSGNMTRASNAQWQSGVWSIPLQFYAYNARVMEQLLGGRLTGMEKARMMATFSLLYGIPIGVGASVGALWPVYDSVKEAAYANGIDLDNGWTKIATEGLMNTMQSWVTGKDYNVAQRYGPGNNGAIRDALSGDKTLSEVLFGASGTIANQIVKASAPFAAWTASIFTGKDSPVFASDWMTLFRNSATIDNATKMYMASVYGKWQTSTGSVVDSKVDSMDAAMVALGLQPLRVANTFMMQHTIKDMQQAQATLTKSAMEDYRRGLQAAAEGDYDKAEAYRKRATTAIQAADLNTMQQQKAFHAMRSQNLDLADKVKWDLMKMQSGSNYQPFFQKFINPGNK